MAAAHLAQPGVFLEIRRPPRLSIAREPRGTDLLLEGLACMHTDGRGGDPDLAAGGDLARRASRGRRRALGLVYSMASNVIWDPDAATAIFERQAQIVRGSFSPRYDRVWSGEFEVPRS